STPSAIWSLCSCASFSALSAARRIACREGSPALVGEPELRSRRVEDFGRYPIMIDHSLRAMARCGGKLCRLRTDLPRGCIKLRIYGSIGCTCCYPDRPGRCWEDSRPGSTEGRHRGRTTRRTEMTSAETVL